MLNSLWPYLIIFDYLVYFSSFSPSSFWFFFQNSWSVSLKLQVPHYHLFHMGGIKLALSTSRVGNSLSRKTNIATFLHITRTRARNSCLMVTAKGICFPLPLVLFEPILDSSSYSEWVHGGLDQLNQSTSICKCQPSTPLSSLTQPLSECLRCLK